jgi:arginine decarboxylase
MKLLKQHSYWNSSAFDINIVENLVANGKINKSTYVICNGFKRDQYIENISLN